MDCPYCHNRIFEIYATVREQRPFEVCPDGRLIAVLGSATGMSIESADYITCDTCRRSIETELIRIHGMPAVKIKQEPVQVYRRTFSMPSEAEPQEQP